MKGIKKVEGGGKKAIVFLDEKVTIGVKKTVFIEKNVKLNVRLKEGSW